MMQKPITSKQYKKAKGTLGRLAYPEDAIAVRIEIARAAFEKKKNGRWLSIKEAKCLNDYADVVM